MRTKNQNTDDRTAPIFSPRRMFLSMVLFGALLMAGGSGCSREPRLRCDSESSYDESLDRMTAGLTASQTKELQQAMLVVMTEGETDLITRWPADPEGMIRKMRKKLDGMTRDEILARAVAIEKELNETGN